MGRTGNVPRLPIALKTAGKEDGCTMNFLSKLERKFGRYAIPNLTIFLIGAYVIGYVFSFVNEEMMSVLTLNPYYILKGQVWRIFTWVLVPPESLDIFTIIMLLFYYSLGSSLERTWGTFRYNVYIFGGMILTVVGAFLLYGVYELFLLKEVKEALMDISSLAVVAEDDLSILYEAFYSAVFGSFSTYYINLSIFLAFAASYPDMQVLLYFIIPVKIKWMAYINVAFLVYQIYQYTQMPAYFGLGGIVAILVSLLNFLVFFFMTRNYRRISPKEIHRKNAYRRQVNHSQRITKHKCAICGRTDEDPDAEFRFCSKCNGNYEYCQEHLFTHQHIQ